MRSIPYRLTSCITTVAIAASLVPTPALANAQDTSFIGALVGAEAETSAVIEGDYNFTATRMSNLQMSDHFTFREDCFQRSSFLGCSHLAVLSAQLAEASQGWFGNDLDPYEDNLGETGHNMVAMLSAMGFSNVEVNDYCGIDTQENSMGVAVGTRQIVQDDEEYTLIAIVPRSGGYKREWVGNFNVGSGSVHKGFKEARDEVLRFTKSYASEHNIGGKVKIWTVGHSRGGAVANLVAGFFAGDAGSFLNSNSNSVTVSPEDIYCYTYASPNVVKSGMAMSEILSVSAARGGSYASTDTPGEKYRSSATGTLDPADSSIYGGIRNFVAPTDPVPSVPPTSWGFTLYGTNLDADLGVLTVDQMAEQLAGTSNVIYGLFTQGGDPRAYSPLTIDLLQVDANKLALDSLPLVEATEDQSLDALLDHLVTGLTSDMDTNADYVSKGYEKTLQAAAGCYFLLNGKVTGEGGLAGLVGQDASGNLLKGLLFGYLDYAAGQLKEEGRASSDAEATTIVVRELLACIARTGVNAEENVNLASNIKTFDDFLAAFAKILGDNGDSPLVQSLLDRVLEIPMVSDNRLLVCSFMGSTKKGGFDMAKYMTLDTAGQNAMAKDLIVTYLRALYYGPEEGAENQSSPEALRLTVYSLLTLLGVPDQVIGYGRPLAQQSEETVVPGLSSTTGEGEATTQHTDDESLAYVEPLAEQNERAETADETAELAPAADEDEDKGALAQGEDEGIMAQEDVLVQDEGADALANDTLTAEQPEATEAGAPATTSDESESADTLTSVEPLVGQSEAVESDVLAPTSDEVKAMAVLMGSLLFGTEMQIDESISAQDDSSGDTGYRVLNGSAPFENLVSYLLGMVMTVKDDSGAVVAEYKSLGEAADASILGSLQTAAPGILSKCKEAYGDAFSYEIGSYLTTLSSNVPLLRNLIFNTLFSADETYSTENNLATVATLLTNANILALSHYNEEYLSWARAASAAGLLGDHDSTEPDKGSVPTPTPSPTPSSSSSSSTAKSTSTATSTSTGSTASKTSSKKTTLAKTGDSAPQAALPVAVAGAAMLVAARACRRRRTR